MSELLANINSQMAAVVGDVQRSLVQLTNGRKGHGAGTIWHSEGLILTNAHVAQRHAPKVTLWDGRAFDSQLLGYDEKLDLAALAIRGVVTGHTCLPQTLAEIARELLVVFDHKHTHTGTLAKEFPPEST